MSYRIVISAFNEEKNLRNIEPNRLNFFKTNNQKILFIDDGSSDKTPEILTKLGLQVITNKKNQRKLGAYHDVLSKLKEDYVALTDVDSYFEGDLEKTIEFMESKDADALMLSVTPSNADKNYLTKMQDFAFLLHDNTRIKVIHISGAGGVYRRSALTKALDSLKIRGLLYKFEGGDVRVTKELLLSGCKICYCPEEIIRAKTKVSESLMDLLRQKYRWYKGKKEPFVNYPNMMFKQIFNEFPHGIVGSFKYISKILDAYRSGQNTTDKEMVLLSPIFSLGNYSFNIISFYVSELENLKNRFRKTRLKN